MLPRTEVLLRNVAPFEGFHLRFQVVERLFVLLLLNAVFREILANHLDRLEVVVLVVGILGKAAFLRLSQRRLVPNKLFVLVGWLLLLLYQFEVVLVILKVGLLKGIKFLLDCLLAETLHIAANQLVLLGHPSHFQLP